MQHNHKHTHFDISKNIKTKRLRLRAVVLKDAKKLAKLVDDKEIAVNVSHIPHPYAADDALHWIRTLGDEMAFAVRFHWRLVGCIGLNPVSQTQTELGYWIGRKWWGRGFATEAARAMLPMAFANPQVALVTAAHFSDNPESGNVLKKLGFLAFSEGERWCEARGCKVASVEYRLSRNTFEASLPKPRRWWMLMWLKN